MLQKLELACPGHEAVRIVRALCVRASKSMYKGADIFVGGGQLEFDPVKALRHDACPLLAEPSCVGAVELRKSLFVAHAFCLLVLGC